MALALAALFTVAEAQSHPSVVKASPKPEAIGAAPSAIRLQFDEAIMLPFSGLELVDARGKTMQTGKATIGQNGFELIVPVVARLAPGRYRVHWHAVSADTHRIEGQYAFSVR